MCVCRGCGGRGCDGMGHHHSAHLPEKGPQSHGEEPQEGKPGYCEPCAVRYQSLCMVGHMTDVGHMSKM